MRLFYSLLTFGIAFQFACYLFWAFDVTGGLINYPIDLAVMNNAFAITPFTMMFLAGGAVGIGLAALLLRQGTYAVYAILIWAAGVFLSITAPFFLAIPNTITGLLSPLLDVTNPFATGTPHPFIVVIGAIFGFAIWWFIMELVTQRNYS